ncbi:electron transport complex protein RnfD [Aggregatibacter actinomycetemcomitans serotype e str. SC1083]|uniref:Ion-translocating oxidoreductase complex subunit D n=1 Tax=Aggregatibacter actinomycetemcomitans serotype e str. SC1083 TaxID=907488 RepID=G4A873_AGGAC|nr:electron transport complex subunit RsxD [Aggregatibacter actinomycetemcomitans]EGY34039.1 electron transport complex protein RnfD [Aggregatibacter actinomycetemcomitans serotype e str. SC1083]KYK72314.1 electron transporter RnfG [Aggregatibacter actinomycetemcomitans serotype e str. SA3096]KYK77869.1 electron transporter RnfG [Aggregatibacter actinomycetemcomitans serotype e str. SC936]KYK95191.1 electron transporter RnfG [Aggregatibacter actinomycetemcomitans serotype e str. ANH9776]MBN607
MFKMISSPHTHSGKLTARVMFWVIFAMIPAIVLQIHYFGFGVLIQSALAIGFALLLELAVTLLRKKRALSYISDVSVILTALILAVAIPPYAPYWVILIGTFCAVILGKHVYGGLGQNPFNPAMVGYVVLLVSFPLQMTTWMPPIALLAEPPTFHDAALLIFSGLTSDGFSLHQLTASIDGITQATPLDSARTFYSALCSDCSADVAFYDLVKLPIFMQNGWDLAQGWWQINVAFLIGGVFLILKKVIHWQIPAAMLGSFVLLGLLTELFGNGAQLSLPAQLLSGAMMFGAFFIATDPVTASITPRGKLVFGALVGSLLYLIRFYGNYPDGVAFAILLSNICVPLIDHYTRPRVTGHRR